MEKNLIINGKGRLGIRDITLPEASESRHNTEEPLFDNENEDEMYRNPEESPLFPTEKRLSEERTNLHQLNGLEDDVDEEPLFGEETLSDEEGKR